MSPGFVVHLDVLHAVKNHASLIGIVQVLIDDVIGDFSDTIAEFLTDVKMFDRCYHEDQVQFRDNLVIIDLYEDIVYSVEHVEVHDEAGRHQREDGKQKKRELNYLITN